MHSLLVLSLFQLSASSTCNFDTEFSPGPACALFLLASDIHTSTHTHSTQHAAQPLASCVQASEHTFTGSHSQAHRGSQRQTQPESPSPITHQPTARAELLPLQLHSPRTASLICSISHLATLPVARKAFSVNACPNVRKQH